MSTVILSGGVGGAKLVLGMAGVLPPDQLTVIANTGDDFEHFGLPVCTDLDTLMYTLSGQANAETGWGVANESWDFMDAVAALDGDTWFRLGDQDLATHARRLELLRAGHGLAHATRVLFEEAEVPVPVWPMTEAPVRTRIKSTSETYDFQEYFVRLRAEPVATGFEYSGAGAACAPPQVLDSLRSPALDSVVIAPSNPWLSVDPILSIADIASCIRETTAPIVAVSPIVRGRAIKGPAAKLMDELGIDVSVLGIAAHYRDVIDGLIIDEQDAKSADAIREMGLHVGVTQTIMKTISDKQALATYALKFAASLRDAKPT